jgi:Tfp pilus assembly protein PilO
MFKFAVPIILIGIAIAGFFMIINPTYTSISVLNTQVASYNEALNNSKTLEAERDKLTLKYNSIDPNNLAKLQKLLPDNVDNIRLILEIEKIAAPYGMVLKDVKYDTITNKTDASTSTTNTIKSTIAEASSGYGTWNLEFSTQGTYSNFLNFVKDLESNLRIVDIVSVDFSSSDSSGTGLSTSASTSSPKNDSYKYSFKIKTYWLKD